MSARRDWRSEFLNGAAAAIVAVLIWLYANDRTRESSSVIGTVRITSSDPRALYAEPTAPATVNVELRGSRRSIDRVEEILRGGLTLTTGSEGVPDTPGTHEISLADAIARNASVAATGAEVMRVLPESMRIEVGALVTEQVSVTPVLPRAAVQGEIVMTPAVAAVTLPAAARDTVGTLTLEALVDTKNLGPGQVHQVDVELKLPDSFKRWKEQIRIVPPRAKVEFTLLATTGDYTIPDVPVEISVIPAVLDIYRITLAPSSTTAQRVQVSGPLAGIDRLRNGQFHPAAVVILDPENMIPGTHIMPVGYWRLPEGISVTSVGGSPVSGTEASPVEVTVIVEPLHPATSPVPAHSDAEPVPIEP